MTVTAYKALALIRIGLGIYFFTQVWVKTVTEGWLRDGGAMAQSIREDLPSSVSVYRLFLEEVVLNNASLFASLVVLGEWAVTLSLLFGVLSRLGALIGLSLMINFMLMQGLLNAISSSNLPIFAIFLAFALTGASAAWSLDKWLVRKFGHVGALRWFMGLGDSQPGTKHLYVGTPSRQDGS